MDGTKKIKCYANLELLIEGTAKKHKFCINRRLGGYTLKELIHELEKYQKEIDGILEQLQLRTKKPASRLSG